MTAAGAGRVDEEAVAAGPQEGRAGAQPQELLRAQVVYRQGMVKDFVCSGEMTLSEFMRRASAFGKVRLLRSLRPVRDLRAESGYAWIGDNSFPKIQES